MAFLASLVILFLALGKGVVGYLFNSHLLVADAFHSAGDMVTVAASGFGLWLAARRKTEKFPYGLYKAETIATLFIGMLIVWAGVEMARDGFSKFFHASTALEFPLLPVVISAISVITSLILARKEYEVGKAVNSQSLQVTAREMFLDTFVSSAVLIGILMTYWRIPNVEGGLIMVISLLILKLGEKASGCPFYPFWTQTSIRNCRRRLNKRLPKQAECKGFRNSGCAGPDRSG